jgi:hypothetical protein
VAQCVASLAFLYAGTPYSVLNRLLQGGLRHVMPPCHP